MLELPSKKILLDQRVSIVRWHSEVCPDGSQNRSHSWKSKIAEKLNVSPATITTMVKPANSSRRRRGLTKAERSLSDLDDETFIKILWSQNGVTPKWMAESDKLLKVRDQLANVRNETEYAQICLNSGLMLREDRESLARSNVERREKEELERRERTSWHAPASPYWFQLADVSRRDDKAPRQVPMHDTEVDDIEEVVGVLTDEARATPWTATLLESPPHSGVTYALQRLLPEQPRFATFYRGGTHHVHLDMLDGNSTLKNVLENDILQSRSSNASPTQDRHKNEIAITKAVANYLYTNSQILIIHRACLASADDYRIILLIAEKLKDAGAEKKRPTFSRLLLSCWDKEAYVNLNQSNIRIAEYNPRITRGNAKNYFMETTNHYRSLRIMIGSKRPSTTTFPPSVILKRVTHHYDEEYLSSTQLPSAVRFRAFCASDIHSPSPFDPTAGIQSKINGDIKDSIPEILTCIRDIHSDLLSQSAERKRYNLQPLRLISTSLFYFTKSMLERLKKVDELENSLQGIEFDFGYRANRYLNSVSFPEEIEDQARAMPLLVRSFIQDEWRWSEPTSRAAVHEAIGDILVRAISSESKEFLQRELPYASPWGHEPVVLALEAIRHYVRAAQSYAGIANNQMHLGQEKSELLKIKALNVYDKFMEGGSLSNSIAANNNEHASEGQISRKHGLYGLKLEVLCLLSEDGQGAQPPACLSPLGMMSYYCELGIALTRMMRPTDALRAFSAGLAIADIPDTSRVYMLAHAINAQIMLGDLVDARRMLEQARTIEVKHNLKNDERNAIQDRNNAREAVILTVEGSADRALQVWNQLEEKGLFAFRSDRAVSFIDAVLASPSFTANAGRVWRIAEQAANNAYNSGYEHERLRIEIRRSAIVRRLGYPQVAEAILDQVGLDLGEHGGGEMVFKEFQFESAEVLGAIGRPRYAIAAYAWPACLPLLRSDAAPWSARAVELCLRLLDMHSEEGATLDRLDQHPFWRRNEANDRRRAHPFFSVALLPPIPEVQSLFSHLASDTGRAQFRKKLMSTEVNGFEPQMSRS